MVAVLREDVDRVPQLVDVERLREHEVDVEILVGVHVLLGQVGREDRDFPGEMMGAQFAHELEAVHFRHLVIGDDHVKRVCGRGDFFQRLGAVAGGGDLAGGPAEDERKKLCDSRLIFHGQDFFAFLHKARSQIAGAGPRRCRQTFCGSFFLNETFLRVRHESFCISGVRVLIADDERAFARTLAEMVRLSGHEVVDVVHSGLAAIRAYRRLRPEVVLMDFAMAHLNGLTACRHILSEDPTGCILFLSGLSEHRPLAPALSGAFAVLQKPIAFGRLEQVLQDAAKREQGPATESWQGSDTSPLCAAVH